MISSTSTIRHNHSVKTPSNMKSIAKILSVGVAALGLTATVAQAQPVTVNWDSSFEGLALPGQTPLGAGVIEIGWLNAGTTEAMIDALFASNDYAGVDSLLNTVGTITFSIGSPNTFGNGLVFEGLTLVSDHIGDAAGFAAYKNVTTGAAGKQIFGWIRDSASFGSTTANAFIATGQLFGTANDTNTFGDFEANAATDSFSITGSNVWVGSLNPVILGGGVDLNGGSLADSTGLNGGSNVLVLAAAVPEPSTAVLGLLGLLGLGLRRQRKA